MDSDLENTPTTMTGLPDHVSSVTVDRVRSYAGRFFQFISCTFVVVSTVVAWLGGQNVLVTFLTTGAAAATAFGAMAVFEHRLPARLLVTLSFDIQVITLIFATSNFNAAFVEEAHTIYAVFNLYLIAYMCWRSLVLYNGFIIVHHIVMTLLMPQVLWADAAPWEGLYHAAIHSLLGVLLTASFVFTVQQFKRTLRSNEEARARASTASADASTQASQAERERSAAEQTTARVRESAHGIDGQLRTFFKETRQATFELGGSASSVTTLSRTCHENTAAVKLLFERTAANIEDVARSADVLARSVDEIACRADAAARKANDAVAKSAQAGRLVEALELSGQRVGDISRIIRTVAGSINLIALNATIEAARAGTAGRGFAVVAQNVKALAAETSQATAEISRVIVKIQNQTSGAIAAINTIADKITAAHDHATDIAAATARQRVVTGSIADTASTIAHDASEVRDRLTATLDLLVSANAMSAGLLGASEGLRRTAESSTEDCALLLGRLCAG